MSPILRRGSGQVSLMLLVNLPMRRHQQFLPEMTLKMKMRLRRRERNQ